MWVPGAEVNALSRRVGTALKRDRSPAPLFRFRKN
jgi:hypothetical protein